MDDASPSASILSAIGFKAIMCWHYIVLFSPLLVIADGQDFHQFHAYFFERQLVLYVSLGVSFVIFALLSRYLLQQNKTLRSLIVVSSIGALGVVSTIMTSPLALPLAAKLAATVALGFSEAGLMFLWLHFYMEREGEHLYSSFAVDMIVGGALALLICFLEQPVCHAVTACLPAIAAFSLLMNWRSADLGTVRPSASPSEVLRIPRDKASWKALVPVVVYALSFGLLQGAFLESGIVILMAADLISLIGIIVAGVIIFAVVRTSRVALKTDLFHRVSLLLFVLGTVGLSFFGQPLVGDGTSIVLCEIVILAGFNLFDFGELIRRVNAKKDGSGRARFLVDGGRLLVYFGLAAGLAIGTVVVTLLPDDGSLALHSFCGIVVVLLVATVLMPFSSTTQEYPQVENGVGGGRSEKRMLRLAKRSLTLAVR